MRVIKQRAQKCIFGKECRFVYISSAGDLSISDAAIGAIQEMFKKCPDERVSHRLKNIVVFTTHLICSEKLGFC